MLRVSLAIISPPSVVELLVTWKAFFRNGMLEIDEIFASDTGFREQLVGVGVATVSRIKTEMNQHQTS